MGDLDGVQLGLKTLSYLGLILLVGAGAFEVGVIPPPTSDGVRRRLRGGLVAGWLLLTAAGFADCAHTCVVLTGSLDGPTLHEYLLHTHPGVAFFWRAGAGLLLALLLWRGRPTRLGMAVSGALALTVLASYTATSHAAALGRGLPWAADLLHLVGVVTWPALLLYCTVLHLGSSRVRTEETVAWLPRLSAMSFASVAVLAATGGYAAWQHLPAWSALWQTQYGRALLLKSALVGVVLLVAGVNRWRLMPRLPEPPAVRLLVRMIAIEALLVVGVVGLTALLTTRDVPDVSVRSQATTASVEAGASDPAGPGTTCGPRRSRRASRRASSRASTRRCTRG